MATALLRTADEVLHTCCDAIKGTPLNRMQCVHILVGDGVATNENAAKRLWLHYSQAYGPDSRLAYRLATLKCASHQANLAVLVAIAGRLSKDAGVNDELCATLTRMYKYILPGYLSEFSAVLRATVADNFQLRHDLGSDETAAHRRRTDILVALYGPNVLPPALTAIRNRDIARMEHVAPEGAEPGPIMKRMFDVLERQVLIVEEKTVVTRFFLFAPCAFALLRMELTQDILSVSKVSPAAENAKRIKARACL